MMKQIKYCLTIALMILVTASAQAKRNKKKNYETMPKAIFVQLYTYNFRANLYKKKNAVERGKQLKIDRDSVMQKEIMDFSDNFSFCPVYYFIDSNFYKVKSGQLSGLILDKNLNPVQTPLPDDYFIVTFAYPIPNSDDQKEQTKSNDILSGDEVLAKDYQKLVVMNKKGTMVKKPELNNTNYIDGPLKQPRRAYTYRSPIADIVYRPYAKSLSYKLRNYYN